jgi:hypothetical protein
MYGTFFEAVIARDKLLARGYSRELLNLLQEAGQRQLQMYYQSQLEITELTEEERRMYTEIHKKANSEKTYFPLRAAGVDLLASSSLGASYYLNVVHPRNLVEQVRKRKFLEQCKNVKVSTIEPYQRARLGLARNLSFLSIPKEANVPVMFKVTKLASKVFVPLGILASANDAYSSDEIVPIRAAKFSLDMVMMGVAFIPPAGWAVSGIYFATDAAVGSAEPNWFGKLLRSIITSSPSYGSTSDQIRANAMRGH